MKITGVDKVEDCFDGTSAVRYSFDQAWNEESILSLKCVGKLDYFPDFPRPFFRVIEPRGMQLKGIAGEDNCLAIFPKEGREAIKREFEERFS